MRRLAPYRVTVLLVVAAVLLFVVNVYLGTGGRAEARCLDSFFVPGGEWSWSHLGTRCEFGEPTQVGYARSPLFFVMLFVLGAALFAAYNAHKGRRPKP